MNENAALPPDFELLAASYLTGDIDADGVKRLEALLRENQAARDCFAALAAQDIALRQALRASAEAARPPSESLKILLNQHPPPRKSWRWALGLSAAVLALGATLAFVVISKTQAPLAKIDAAAAGATVLRAGNTKAAPISADAGLYNGDTLTTPAHGDATFSFAGEATTIALDAGTEVRVRSDNSAKRIDLTRGALTCAVAKQPANRPLMLQTPKANAEVLGTRFMLSASASTTKLEVSEGRVKLTRRTDGASAVVSSGQQLAIGPSVAPLVVGPSEASLAAAGWRSLLGADLSNWKIMQGEWRIEDGELLGIAHGPTKYDYALIRTKDAYEDFELTCQVRVEKGAYSEFQVRDDDWQFQNPVDQNKPREWRDVHITASRLAITCTIDGQEASLDTELSTKTKSSGIIGFYVKYAGQVRIRNIHIRLTGDKKAVPGQDF